MREPFQLQRQRVQKLSAVWQKHSGRLNRVCVPADLLQKGSSLQQAQSIAHRQIRLTRIARRVMWRNTYPVLGVGVVAVVLMAALAIGLARAVTQGWGYWGVAIVAALLVAGFLLSVARMLLVVEYGSWRCGQSARHLLSTLERVHHLDEPGRRLRLFSFILPHSIRDRVFEPSFQELLSDLAAAEQYRSESAQRWLRFCFMLRTIVLVIECLRAYFIDTALWAVPPRLRHWWTSV